ncbi:MAG: glycosyltransferase family 2 protein [Bacteroidota bacterium]
MKGNATLISIIIPVFNRPELITECLESIIAQSYDNWECIVVDDGSTDETLDVMETYAQKEQQIKVYKRHKEPKGAPSCRNIGMNEASGDYLIFLDSDDLLAPWALSERIQYACKNPHLDVLLSNGLQFNSQKLELIDYTTIFDADRILNLFLQMQVVFQTSSPTWKRTFLESNNIRWDEKLLCWQDVDFAIQAFSYSPNVSWCSILPDYFLRKDSDINAITSRNNVLPKMVSNFYTYENWLTNENNRPILESSFPDYMLSKLEFLLTEKELKSMLNKHSNLIKKHLGSRSVYYLRLYNNTRNIKFIKGIVYRARPYLTRVKRNKVKQPKYQFNEKVKGELLNKLKEFDSDLFKNYENA